MIRFIKSFSHKIINDQDVPLLPVKEPCRAFQHPVSNRAFQFLNPTIEHLNKCINSNPLPSGNLETFLLLIRTIELSTVDTYDP